MIAHDMRTPLNALTLSIASAKALKDDHQALDDALNLAEKNARALASIVESLLATSEHGPWTRGSLTFRECVPSELVANAADQVRPLAAAKSQKLETGQMTDLPILVADGERVVRVLVNLLSNAVKCAPEGGHIRIEAKLRVNDGHSAIVFTVIDNGIGVSEKDIDRIFMEGVSIAKVGKYSNGLGLTVCKELVEAHGGRIWVETNRAKGAAFSFAIPTDLPPNSPRGFQS